MSVAPISFSFSAAMRSNVRKVDRGGRWALHLIRNSRARRLFYSGWCVELRHGRSLPLDRAFVCEARHLSCARGFRPYRRAWRETDEADTDRATLIQHLFEGQYTNPVRIVS